MSRKIKARWAAKILRSRYFVVLTDKEAAIYVEGADPQDINDQIALAAQTSELEDFSDRLKALIKNHKTALRKWGTRGKKNVATAKGNKAKGKRS